MDNNKLINGAQDIINQLALCNTELKISCNDGGVIINVNTLNFTYIGKFGSMVSQHIIKKGICADTANKLVLLYCYMDIYSYKNGGFTLVAN